MSRIVRVRHLLWPIWALVAGLTIAFVSSAGASTPKLYFGSSLDHSPANAGARAPRMV